MEQILIEAIFNEKMEQKPIENDVINAERFFANLTSFLVDAELSHRKIMSASFRKTKDDIYRLYSSVKSHGGYYHVNRMKLWALLLEELELHPEVMPVNVRNFYQKYLLPYAQFKGEIVGEETIGRELNGSVMCCSPQPFEEKISTKKPKKKPPSSKKAKKPRSDEMNLKEFDEQSYEVPSITPITLDSPEKNSNSAFGFGEQPVWMSTPLNNFQSLNSFQTPPFITQAMMHCDPNAFQTSSSSTTSFMQQNPNFFQPPPMVFHPQFGASYGYPYPYMTPFANYFPSNPQRFGLPVFPFVFPNPGQYFNGLQRNFDPQSVEFLNPSASKQRKIVKITQDDDEKLT